jgi:hypothetical protein
VNEDIREWAKRAAEASKELQNSTVMTSIVTRDFMKDPLCALQLGMAILWNKPIVLLVDKTMTIPPALTKVADLIQHIDVDDPNSMKRGEAALREFIERLP